MIDLANLGIGTGGMTTPLATVLVSLIGAVATIIAASMQLRVAWHKEMLARAGHKPVTRKAKRGPIVAVIVLLLASAVGGFTLSQYLATGRHRNDAALEAELRGRINQLTASAQSLEKIRLFGQEDLLRQLRAEESLRVGNDGVATILGVGKCVSASTEAKSCNEQNALPLQLCVEIPITVSVSAIELFARRDDVLSPWHERRVIAGQDFGSGRFSEQPRERVISEKLKQVCQGVSYWNSEFNLQARMVVHFTAAEKLEPTQKLEAREQLEPAQRLETSQKLETLESIGRDVLVPTVSPAGTSPAANAAISPEITPEPSLEVSTEVSSEVSPKVGPAVNYVVNPEVSSAVTAEASPVAIPITAPITTPVTTRE